MNEKKRLLLCEDDENLGMLLREYLQAKDYNTELCSDGIQGLESFNTKKADLCVLDVMMPRMDGFTLAREIHKISPETPIIFLTARDAHDDQLTGFANGADDYITKPFSFDTVLARVRAVLRRTTNNGQRTTADNQQATEGYINIGGISIDMEHGKVVLNGKTLALTRREYLILCLLAQKADNYFTREAILEQVWPNDALVNDRSVDVHIARLRKKLDHEGGRLINRTGFGYMIRSFEDTEMDRTKVDTL